MNYTLLFGFSQSGKLLENKQYLQMGSNLEEKNGKAAFKLVIFSMGS